ncbi:MAG: hybrid sensor histidine kinase/response regulator [Massilia sp.]|nr:hybrid sensor histidine kinase/response regulator [Massilia sp.]
MASTKSLSLRTFLVLLVSLGLLPLALIGAWVISTSVDERQNELERSMLALSRALASAIDSELETTVGNLTALSKSPELINGDVPRFYDIARTAAKAQDDWRSVILTDATGRPVFRTSLPFGAPASKIVDPESLALTMKSRRPTVGKVAKGVLQSAAVPVRVPVVVDGQLRYVLTAALAPTRVLRILNNQQLPQGWVVSVQDSYGFRVARSVDHERTVATGMSPTLVKLLQPGLLEGTGITKTLEGDEVLTSYARLPRYAWTVIIGAPTAHFTEVLRRTLATYASAIIASLAVYIALALVLSRRIVVSIAHLKDQTRRLGQKLPVGPVYSRIREVNEMGAGLVKASEELLRNERERESLLVSLKQALARAEQAATAKDNFLAVLGHELRNPLAPILMALDLMDIKPGDDCVRERQTMRRQVEHMKRLVDDLLDVSRISQGQLVMKSEPVCLAAVVTHVADAMKPAMAAQGRHFIESLEKVWVMGDETRLVQVVSNLLANALRYGGEGDVRISVARDGDKAVLRVSDSGVGMEPATAALIFQPFYQAPQSLARSSGGLGLGLAIVARIVEVMKGSVGASSPGLGQGSSFEIVLNAIDERAPAASPDHHGSRQPSPRRIMIVDDNVDAASTTAELLSLLGHHVELAHDGRSALALFQAMRPEVAFLDIGLPDMDGFELAQSIRQLGFGGTLVALTGYGEERDKRRANDAGFDVHLTKPASLDDLEAAILQAGQLA